MYFLYRTKSCKIDVNFREAYNTAMTVFKLIYSKQHYSKIFFVLFLKHHIGRWEWERLCRKSNKNVNAIYLVSQSSPQQTSITNTISIKKKWFTYDYNLCLDNLVNIRIDNLQQIQNIGHCFYKDLVGKDPYL